MKTKLTALCFSLLLVGMADAQNSDSLLTYNYRSLVARSDLSFNTPAPSTHDGLPIGNGRMGTLVWTTPAALHYQINDVDLFCNDKNTLASPEGHTDFSSGCAYVDINLVDYGNDVFAGDKFNQHLSVYDGLESADGDGVKTRSLAWTDGDVIAANLGMGEIIKTVVPGQMHSNPETNAPANSRGRGQLRNRMVIGEGPGTIEFEHLGNASHALQNALLQSVPPSVEKEPVNTVFPAWPKGWDAQFTLAARGAFLISASTENDQIEFVEILSEKGGPCILKNLWPNGDATVYRNGKAAEGVSGQLLTLSTTSGERLALVPKGKVPVAKTLR